ncbi:Phenylalanyl-tRNA synthetase [Favolaschia claudopus]|uniref:Phenylalanine--tRNA ligase, mitochondrial n=1 Tax=Favolaschia claudopus TaxID=2862362 RepID=A0AAW0ANI6_9AGAR
MAQPSSTHHERTERDRDRDRHHRSDRDRSHHHHRTISSTTLLLVLSLVLAGLAVMLSLPRQYNADPATEATGSNSAGVFGYLSPKRTQALIQRERDVAQREAEVARREAELLVGTPGGVASPNLCAPCAATTVFETIAPPIQTIIKEIVKEDSLTPPGWTSGRADEILDRELRITERERDVSKREESVNRREHDASRRESWIMEQLIALGSDNPETVEEEYVYEPKRKAKISQLPPIELPIETKTIVQTVTVPAPANTRRAAFPSPQPADPSSIAESPRTTAVEIITEQDVDDGLKTVTVVRSPKAARRPARGWFGGCAFMLRSQLCLPFSRQCIRRRISALANGRPTHLEILGDSYPTDNITNLTPAILAKVPLRLHTRPSHPLNTLRGLIESHYSDFTHLSSLSPLVSPYKNFDELSFPQDHPGRAVTDSYYVNKDLMLRTHTSAHEVEVFRRGEDRWLLTADVYRRDEIDGSHYPIFHQMEGARIFSADASGMKEVIEDNERLKHRLALANIVIEDVPHVSETNPSQPTHDPAYSMLVAENLKLSLNSLMLTLFGGQAGAGGGAPLRVRWIEAYFPFTSPSFEVEVFFRGKWLEILGSGVVRQATLDTANVHNKIGWAFGLGLERIAMILYSIPDIRLFWSTDERFISQFKDKEINTFQPYSKYPSCFKDVSFWTAQGLALHENDFCDVVRDVAGDLVEDVKKLDYFVHPKTNRTSLCYRINYRSMDRSLSNEEANEVQAQVVSRLQEQFGVEIR